MKPPFCVRFLARAQPNHNLLNYRIGVWVAPSESTKLVADRSAFATNFVDWRGVGGRLPEQRPASGPDGPQTRSQAEEKGQSQSKNHERLVFGWNCERRLFFRSFQLLFHVQNLPDCRRKRRVSQPGRRKLKRAERFAVRPQSHQAPEALLGPFIVAKLELDLTQSLPGHGLHRIRSDSAQCLRLRRLEVPLRLINRRQIDRRQQMTQLPVVCVVSIFVSPC